MQNSVIFRFPPLQISEQLLVHVLRTHVRGACTPESRAGDCVPVYIVTFASFKNDTNVHSISI
nr:MAG TPA: hypothetical protein [Caudoviricetes sp.]